MAWKKLQISKHELEGPHKAFKKKARFYIDENIEEEIVEFLFCLDWNIKTFKDFSLTGRSNERHFAKAGKLNRILITQDNDFWDNEKFPVDKHPGVIIMQYQDYHTAGQAIRFINDVIFPFVDIWHNSKVGIAGDEITVFSRNIDDGVWSTKRYKLDGNGIPYIWEE